MMNQRPRPQEPHSNRKRASVYVDEDFQTDDRLPSQESLSAFGLKLVDSRKTFAEFYGITTTPQTFSSNLSHYPQSANADMPVRKKRKKSSQINLADLNSVVDVDALLKKNENVSAATSIKDGKANPGDKDPKGQTKILRQPRYDSETMTRFDSNGVPPPESAQLSTQGSQLPEQPEVISHPPAANVMTRATAEPKTIMLSANHSVARRNPRSSRKGFFKNQLPSRIPKRPRPEQFSATMKPRRPFALRQLNAVNSKMNSSSVEAADAAKNHEFIDDPKPGSPGDSSSNEDISKPFLVSRTPSQPSVADLRLDRRCHHLERNLDCGLPRNPDSAVKSLLRLPSVKRSAFLEHIFYFFNHSHLAILVRSRNGQFITCLEKWIEDGIKSNDAVLLRAVLLLLEVLPVTPSSHCRGLMKILKTTQVTDSVIKNLCFRVIEKWHFLEQTIRSHKASKDKESECKRSISFCDETETLQYSIYLPPDTVRKTKKCSIKGALKQAIRTTAVKDAPPRNSSESPAENNDSIPQDPRLSHCFQSSGEIVFPASDGLESISSSDLATFRQSFDSESPCKMSNVPFGSEEAIPAPPGYSYDSNDVDIPADLQASPKPEASQSVCSAELLGADQILGEPESQIPSDSQSLLEIKATQDIGFGLASSAVASVTENLAVPIAIPEQFATLTEANGVSVNTLLSLVPNIIKDFSSSLLSSQNPPVKAISPNPFLSSSKGTFSQVASLRAMPSDQVVRTELLPSR